MSDAFSDTPAIGCDPMLGYNKGLLRWDKRLGAWRFMTEKEVEAHKLRMIAEVERRAEIHKAVEEALARRKKSEGEVQALLAKKPELADNLSELARLTGYNRNTFTRSKKWQAALERARALKPAGPSRGDYSVDREEDAPKGSGRRVFRSKPPGEK
jgi:hypothetical protein